MTNDGNSPEFSPSILRNNRGPLNPSNNALGQRFPATVEKFLADKRVLALFCLFLPPLAVLLKTGVSRKFALSLLLFAFFIFPGILYGFYITFLESSLESSSSRNESKEQEMMANRRLAENQKMSYGKAVYNKLYTVKIDTDKTSYFPGEMVEGTVTLNLFTALSVGGIVLKLKGVEKVTILDAFGVPVIRKDMGYPYCNRKIIVQRGFDLKKNSEILKPGSYSFPFKIRLEHNLPGSSVILKDFQYGIVFYKLKAVVFMSGNQALPPIKYTQRLFINQAPPGGMIQAVNLLKDVHVTKFCCIDMGKVIVTASMDKNIFQANEIARIRINIDNTASDVELKHVTFQLIHNLSLKSRQMMCAKSYTETCCKTKAPQVPKGEIVNINFDLSLPIFLVPTTQGEWYQSTYEFQVILGVPLSQDIIITIPVTILNK